MIFNSGCNAFSDGVVLEDLMRRYRELSPPERLSLQRWHEHGEGVRAIGALMGRSASTISRDLSRSGGRGG